MNSYGKGRNRKNLGLGIQGDCVCQNCGYVVQHQRGVPCYEMTCPKCGNVLSRKGISENNMNNNKPKIDKSLCLGCGRCINACPVSAISMTEGKAHIDEGSCLGCRRCVSVCPADAIK